MPRISYQTLALIIIGFIGFIFAVKMISPEDGWICKDGKWIKHGNPSSAMPIKTCKGVK